MSYSTKMLLNKRQIQINKGQKKWFLRVQPTNKRTFSVGCTALSAGQPHAQLNSEYSWFFFIVFDYKMYLFLFYLFIHLPGCDAVKKEHDIQALANTQPYGKHVNILKLNLQFNLPSLLWSLNLSSCF